MSDSAIGSFVIGVSAIGVSSVTVAGPPTLKGALPTTSNVVDIVPFQPTDGSPPFQFQATLDGQAYSVVARWNLTGQRWYVYVYDQSGTLVVTLPRIGSPANYDISLVAGYFTSTLVFREATQSFEVGT